MHHNKDVGVADDCQELEIKILSNSNFRSTGFESKASRHGIFSGMYFQQECYNSNELRTIHELRNQHSRISTKAENLAIFDIESTPKWYGLLECNKPVYPKIYQHIQSQSFSMQTPKSQDKSLYPIWDLSYSTAKMIANWQGTRIQDQNPSLMNDPAMLFFEEMKYWLTDELSVMECSETSLSNIANRRHYLNEAFYLITDFKSDKRQLLAIEDRLNQANNIIYECIQNKRTPEILKELIINIDTASAILGNYLHFLLIDEPVTDNFSLNDMSSGEKCTSHLCEILNNNLSTKNEKYLPTTFRQTHSNNPSATYLKIDLQKLEHIPFVAPITQADKAEYLKAATYLELLLELKETFNKVKNLQLKIGSFNTAHHFKDSIEKLTNNLITVLDACKASMQKLFYSANQLKKMQINSPRDIKQSYFMKNLATIETILAKGTTMEDKFNVIFNDVITISSQYQSEIKRMHQEVEDGSAEKAINREITDIIQQLNHFNQIIPSILHKKEFEMDVSTNHSLPEIKPQQPLKLERHEQCIPSQLSISNSSFIWDEIAKIDSKTKQPIYTLRAYNDGNETGYIELFAKPYLCFSEDKTRHNALNFTGVFQTYIEHYPSENSVLCTDLPPDQWSSLTESLTYAGYYGAARGFCNSLSTKINQQEYKQSTTILLNQLLYFSSIYSVNFIKHYEGTEIDQIMLTSLLAIKDTSSMILTSSVINAITSLLRKTSQKLNDNNHTTLGKTVRCISNVSHYSLYALNTYKDGFWNTALKTVTSVVSEKFSTYLGDHLLGTG